MLNRAAPNANLGVNGEGGGDDAPTAPVGKPKTPQQIAAQIRLQHTNAQVEEVL